MGKEAKRLLRLVDQGRARGLIPAVVVLELSLLREAGRRVVGPAEVTVFLETNSAFGFLPINQQQAIDFALLGAIRDPFDRLVVAAARCEKALLLSADTAIQASGLVAVAWDG